MTKQLLAVALLATTVVAARPLAGPIITVDGAVAAARLSREQRAALAPRVEALNAALQKVVAAQATLPHAGPEQRAHVHASLPGVHEECMRLHREILQQLQPEQRAPYLEYLHQQLKASGIDPASLHHGSQAGPGLMPHAVR